MIDSLTLGGAESLVIPFARAVDPRRLDLRVSCLKSIEGNPFEDEIRAQGIPCSNLRSRNLRDFGAFRRLLRLLREERIDLIHAHLTYAAIWGNAAARLTRTPCVTTLHLEPSPDPVWSRSGLRERLMCLLVEKWSAGVVAVSESVRQAYGRQGRIDPGRIAVVPNGIDCEAFDRKERELRERMRRQLGIPPQARLVITVSVLREGKGLDVLLKATPGVLRAVPEAHFLIVGEGPMKSELERGAEQAGLSGRLRFLGFRRDVPALLAASDLFVLPSRAHDAFPTALLEAMGAGLPVVATRVGGIPEIVDAPRTGWLVPPGDHEPLGRAVADLLSRSEELPAMGEAARCRARAEFSSAVWVRRLEEVYARALAAPREARDLRPLEGRLSS